MNKSRKTWKKYITTVCTECGGEVIKEKREYDRRIRDCGYMVNFFCNLSCSSVHRNKNFSADTKKKILEAGKRGSRANMKNMHISFSYYIRRAIDRSAKKTEWEKMNLTKEYLERLWIEQNGKCALSDITINLYREGHNNRLHLASLDRKNSAIGYIIGNVQFVALPLNLAKNNSDNDDFKSFLLEVSKNMVKQ